MARHGTIMSISFHLTTLLYAHHEHRLGENGESKVARDWHRQMNNRCGYSPIKITALFHLKKIKSKYRRLDYSVFSSSIYTSANQLHGIAILVLISVYKIYVSNSLYSWSCYRRESDSSSVLVAARKQYKQPKVYIQKAKN